MSLFDELRRNSKVSVDIPPPYSENFYHKPPRQRFIPYVHHGHESNLAQRFRRGTKIPNAKKQVIDHDRAGIISTQDHGIKVQLAAKSIDEIGKHSNNIITEIKKTLARATVTQIQGLAREVGIPITNSVTDLKNNLTHDLSTIFQNGIDINSKKQNEIITSLQQIATNQVDHIDEIKRTIARATITQIQGIARDVGTPIVNSINDLKQNLNHDIDAIFKSDNTEKQKEIMKSIADLDPSKPDELQQIIDESKTKIDELKSESKDDEPEFEIESAPGNTKAEIKEQIESMFTEGTSTKIINRPKLRKWAEDDLDMDKKQSGHASSLRLMTDLIYHKKKTFADLKLLKN